MRGKGHQPQHMGWKKGSSRFQASFVQFLLLRLVPQTGHSRAPDAESPEPPRHPISRDFAVSGRIYQAFGKQMTSKVQFHS